MLQSTVTSQRQYDSWQYQTLCHQDVDLPDPVQHEARLSLLHIPHDALLINRGNLAVLTHEHSHFGFGDLFVYATQADMSGGFVQPIASNNILSQVNKKQKM